LVKQLEYGVDYRLPLIFERFMCLSFARVRYKTLVDAGGLRIEAFSNVLRQIDKWSQVFVSAMAAKIAERLMRRRW
jgi:hypothetical protein